MIRAKRITPVPHRAMNATESAAMDSLLRSFLEWTLANGLAEQTMIARQQAVGRFIAWGARHGIDEPRRITLVALEAYQRFLFHYRKRDGLPLAPSTRASRLHPVRSFCRWLFREKHLPADPASELAMPRLQRRLPAFVPSVAEVERIVVQPDTATHSGIRDRAILETLYATAARRMELANLRVHDLCLDEETVSIRGGKGGKDRRVPLGRRAAHWVARFLAEVRPLLAPTAAERTLFLTDFGEPFAKNRLGDLVRRYLNRAGIGAPGACHLFRHACATHMLENGADIRFIQELLGHSCLSTTQIYTRVSIAKLREVHRRTHPAG